MVGSEPSNMMAWSLVPHASPFLGCFSGVGTSSIVWRPVRRPAMCNEEEREGSMGRWAMMSDARSSSGGVEFEKRSRRRDMRRRDVSRGKNDQPGGGWIRWPSLEPYVDDQGYLVDPKQVKMSTKILAAALGVALVMAAIHPPPMLTLPRSYLHQGGIIGGGHRDLIQTAAGQAKLWVDLSGKEKTAAELLGYDQDTWDNDGKVAVDRSEWSKLTPVQKRAAQALSIDKELWDSELFVDIYERSWSELTTAQKDDAKLLGFDRQSWDEEKHVWSDDRYWRQLSLDQQHAAENIGYTQEEWDGSRHIYDRSWESLSDVQRESATELGYNKDKWNSDRYVRVDDLYWKDLNDKQRKAARVLGFKQQEWDRATRAGSHSKDIELQRKRAQRKKDDSGKNSCQNELQGPFSWSRCKRASVPYYVPTIMQKDTSRTTFPFGMGI